MMKDEAEGAEKWHLNSRMTYARCACTLVWRLTRSLGICRLAGLSIKKY